MRCFSNHNGFAGHVPQCSQPSLRDWTVLAAGPPTLKRWAIVACPFGTGFSFGYRTRFTVRNAGGIGDPALGDHKRLGRAELELCAPPRLTHNIEIIQTDWERVSGEVDKPWRLAP